MADRVPYFTLNCGIKMPAILMGCYQGHFSAVAEGLEDAIACGYRGLDTAKMYQNEAAVGAAVRQSGLPRADIFVTTKLNIAQADRDNVAASFEASLKRLDIEYIDLYLMHWPHGVKDGRAYNGAPEGKSFNEVWAEMEALLETGKVRAIGVSNFSVKTFEALLATATVVPAVNQVEGHPYNPDLELLAYSNAKGIHTSYYSPFGQGAGSPVLKDDIVVQLAETHDVTPAQLILSWAVAKGISANPRSTNKERMKKNLELVQLSESEVKKIDQIHKQPGKNKRLNVAAYDAENDTACLAPLSMLGWDVSFK
ncbi:hypothetical protein FH972_021519 [Carpinus fangiana]|uniref:NADP-dependent oxidoreductase domain-containing protein n=1 Tax=Carpinus fangiana TaxID=176857 RepID=A0A5N6KRR0_9ROSI|nr:hypothetical protein FH972_021519 [Carpinus fangiana]